MKNLFKFGFLGMALVLGAAACNSTKSDADATADSLENAIETAVETTVDTIDSIGDAAIDTLDSLKQDSL